MIKFKPHSFLTWGNYPTFPESGSGFIYRLLSMSFGMVPRYRILDSLDRKIQGSDIEL